MSDAPVKDEKSEMTKMTMFNIQVCSELSEDDALEWIRRACPAGTSGNWHKTDEPNQRPVPCEKMKGRTHYLFQC